MPCRDQPTYDYYERADEARRHQERLDQMTARACRMARALEKFGHKVPPEDQAWWHAHKRFDRKEGRF